MIPDDVEKIIMTKEDYDRNVEQLLLDKCKAELEVERLNNIINELEKELEERYLDFKDSECEEVRTIAYEDISILQKIKELKGSDKE